MDAGFAQARAQGRPVFLYWGAVWCPPCNQVKATIFHRSDFVERSRSFVSIAIDGDAPGAQQLAERFHVSAYPTMIVFTPDGEEVLRLQEESDPRQFLDALARGLEGGRPARAIVANALSGSTASLDARDWAVLASYPWDEQEGELVAQDRLAGTIASLALASPPSALGEGDRLALAALASSAQGHGTLDAAQSTAVLARIRAVLADPARSRAAFDSLVASADAGPELLPAGIDRRELAGAWERRIAQVLAREPGLFAADRLYALRARAQLQTIERGKPSDAVVREIEQAAARADREAHDPYSRASVISAAGDALGAAGRLESAQRLLEKEVPRSASPFYVMAELAHVAREKGDKTGALSWYAKAVDAARGPATRLQWSARYVVFLTELSPQDGARIGAAIDHLVGEITPDATGLAGRNLGNLRRVQKALAQWNRDGSHEAELAAARQHLASVCSGLGGAAAQQCGGWMAPATGS